LAFSVERVAQGGFEHVAHERVGAAVPAWSGAFAFAGVGRDERGDALADDRLHLRLVPVAGVGDHHPRCVGHAGGGELVAGGVDHWLEVPEV
jgi:hypothetical protein